jgi:rhamnosyl/mannosyltransferase
VKVLHIGKYFEPFKGGVETYLRDLMVGLQGQGVECAALVHEHRRSLRTRHETVDAGGQPLELQRAGTWFRFYFTPVSPTFPWLLRRMLKTFRPDVVHVHLPNPSALWVLAMVAARRLPLVVHWHSDVVTDQLGPVMRWLFALYRPLERRLLQRADLIVATSESYLRSSDSLQLFPQQCAVIPLGLDPRRMAALTALATDAPERSKQLQVLAIGRLTYYKGFGYLVEAAARVPGIQVHIVGHGERKWELRRLADQLGVGDRVTFHGALDDAALAERLLGCDCVCLPSIERTEAFGLVLLEAQYFSRATIVSQVPGSGMGWVAVAGETGLAVPPRDAAELAGALARLRDDRALCRDMGKRGRLRFEQMFAIEHGAATIAARYRDLVAQGARDEHA